MRLHTTLTTLLAALLLLGSSAAAACQARCFMGMTAGSCAHMAPAMAMQASSSANMVAPALAQMASVSMMHFEMPAAASFGQCESQVCASPAPAVNKDPAAALRIPVTIALWPTSDLALDRTLERASVTRTSLPSLHPLAAQNSTLRI